MICSRPTTGRSIIERVKHEQKDEEETIEDTVQVNQPTSLFSIMIIKTKDTSCVMRPWSRSKGVASIFLGIKAGAREKAFTQVNK